MVPPFSKGGLEGILPGIQLNRTMSLFYIDAPLKRNFVIQNMRKIPKSDGIND